MRALFDTSILIASLLEAHPQHQLALRTVTSSRVKDELIVAAHSLVEVYATLTRIPPPLRVSSQQALRLIESNILPSFEVVTLSTTDYLAILRHLSENNLTGGITYDALILHTGTKAGADRIFTFNASHFRRIDPALTDRIVDPATLAQ